VVVVGRLTQAMGVKVVVAAAAVVARLLTWWRGRANSKPKADVIILYIESGPKRKANWSGLLATASVLGPDVSITTALPDGHVMPIRGSCKSCPELVEFVLRCARKLRGKNVEEARTAMARLVNIRFEGATVTRATNVDGIVPPPQDKAFVLVGNASLPGSIISVTMNDGRRAFILIALYPGCAACLHMAAAFVAILGYVLQAPNCIRQGAQHDADAGPFSGDEGRRPVRGGRQADQDREPLFEGGRV